MFTNGTILILKDYVGCITAVHKRIAVYSCVARA